MENYPDPFQDKSPWDDQPQYEQKPTPTTTPEAPVTVNPTAPNPFKIGLTLKAGNAMESEWITPTIYGATADEVARRTIELIHALKQHGVIEMASKAADYTRSQFKGGSPVGAAASPKRFEGGRVVEAGGGSDEQGVTTCAHGPRKYYAKNGWEAMFCPAPQGSDQCPPAFKDKKTGKYALKS